MNSGCDTILGILNSYLDTLSTYTTHAYLDESSMEKNTYSPESTMPSSSAASRISLMVVELAHITTTETKAKLLSLPSYNIKMPSYQRWAKFLFK